MLGLEAHDWLAIASYSLGITWLGLFSTFQKPFATASRSVMRISTFLLLGSLNLTPLRAGTLSIDPAPIGDTPSLIGYNTSHYFPGSNTRAWWRYAGVNGVRIFASPQKVEFSDDLEPRGDGVATEQDFRARRDALRADPLNESYINWPYFLRRLEDSDLYPNNHIRMNHAYASWRSLSIQTCVQITSSLSTFSIDGPEDWAGKWELWQHYYAHAFYLAREFGIERFQIFNEPNHPNANGLTQSQYLERHQLASDGIISALADVNRLYGKILLPNILGPVYAGGPTSSWTSDWGRNLVENLHLNPFGETDPNFHLIHTYDYHQYNSAPSDFGSQLETLNGYLASAASPAERLPTAISEFNVHTGATFDGMPETMDSPSKYPRFGAILTELVKAECEELYAFKFGHTEYSNTKDYPYQKNAMHYIDNDVAPYNVGGINQGGEVYRLFNKAFASGRQLISLTADSEASSLSTLASYDPVHDRYYLFSANDSSSPVSLDIDLSALSLPSGNPIYLEEVSEAQRGGGIPLAPLASNNILSATQPANSVWLLTLPAAASLETSTVSAANDATVYDGANAQANAGTLEKLAARNDPASADNRAASFIQFDLTDVDPASIHFATLSLQAATQSQESDVQAHIYGFSDASWTEDTLTWETAPHLKQGVPAGAKIANATPNDLGTTVDVVGQLFASSTTAQTAQIDVTAFLRRHAGRQVTFLVSQDPRWDITLPSLVPGDTQPDGLSIDSRESANPPLLTLHQLPAAANQPTRLAVPAVVETTIRGGAHKDLDQPETLSDALYVAYAPDPYDDARKTYFQFDLAAYVANPNSTATFTVQTSAKASQAVQLWGLEQADYSLHASVPWSRAPANADSNALQTTGSLTASPIGVPRFVQAAAGETLRFTIPRLGDYLHDDRVTLVLTGAAHESNTASGLELAPTTASLTLTKKTFGAPAPTKPQLAIDSPEGETLQLELNGAPGAHYILQTQSPESDDPAWQNLGSPATDDQGKVLIPIPAPALMEADLYRAIAP